MVLSIEPTRFSFSSDWDLRELATYLSNFFLNRKKIKRLIVIKDMLHLRTSGSITGGVATSLSLFQ